MRVSQQPPQIEHCRPKIMIFSIIKTSVLEGEMYQLSHMLTDQKSVLSAMMELSITGNKSL